MAASAPYARRSFAGGAISTTVPTGMGSADTSYTLAAATGWTEANTWFTVVDRGLSTEEKIENTSITSLVVTVANRGADGTSGVAHSAGCSVQCCHVARDDDEANQVVAAVLGQSGAAKGDILYMLSAAGPNTLTRLPVAPNGGLYAAAAGVPATTLAGSAGQLLQSAGTAVPTFNSTLLQGIASSALGSGTTTSGTYANLSSTSSTVTVTTGTKALVIVTALLNVNTANIAALVSVAVSGASTYASSDSYALTVAANATVDEVSASTIIPFGTGGGSPGALTAGSNVFTAQARTGGGTLTISNCLITVIPIN